MIIDCVSDLHGHYPELEGGDLLIVAGDLTRDDSVQGYVNFKNWILPYAWPLREYDNTPKYKHTIIIAGNHDKRIQTKRNGFDLYFAKDDNRFITYLQDSGTEFEGFKIWGSPWTKRFEGMNPRCMAFTVDTEEELAERWALIPSTTDILITHSPPFSFFDRVDDGELVGSTSLLRTDSNLKLKLHIFGHVHEGYGIWDIRKTQALVGDPPSCVYVNASHVNEHYEPVNKPIRVIL